jgi:hypothetical protein
MNYLQIAQHGVMASVSNGGMTMTTKGVEVTSGCAVGGVLEFKFKVGAPLQEIADAVKSISKNADCNAVGFWLNDGTLYVDAVQIIEDEAEAVELGTARNELAIFNIGTMTEIKL